MYLPILTTVHSHAYRCMHTNTCTVQYMLVGTVQYIPVQYNIYQYIQSTAHTNPVCAYIHRYIHFQRYSRARLFFHTNLTTGGIYIVHRYT